MIIGITTRLIDDYYKVNKDFIDVFKNYNCSIIGILPTNNLNNILDICTSFIIHGGKNYEEYENDIIKYAIKNNKPILGICLGMQLMGSLYNNNLKLIGNNNHLNTLHNININKDSLLYKIIKKNNILVNSYHEEYLINSGIYKISSMNNNIIESIEYNKNKFNIGVQFHPEKDYKNKYMKKIFDAFIDASNIN